jgi:N-methylhydantoinase A
MTRYLLAIDVGGTFTDFVAYEQATQKFSVWKCLTTQADPVKGILEGLKCLDSFKDVDKIRLGTTVVTNALLERSGAVVAYLTTEGFRDVPFMQRGHRKSHYDPTWIKAKPFVRRRHCYEVAERIDFQGDVVIELDETKLRDLARSIRASGEIEAVAVCFLHSYASPRHEYVAKDILTEELPGVPVSISFEVMPRWKEYERASTTIADAYVKPNVSRQLVNIRKRFRAHGLTERISVIKSNGGEMTLEAAAATPIHLSVSGPTGGVVAAKHLAKLTGTPRIVTLDMGGTSTDCATVIDGNEVFTTDFELEFGLPIQLPMIDIRSIGAGGGSIAWIDKGGMLRVGPQSARADPGPACYRRGGTLATVTDANLVLGRLHPDNFLHSQIDLDTEASTKVIKPLAETLGRTLEETALAIVQIANNNMVGLLRSVLTERGLDPRDFTLLAFGGAGPLHVGELLRAFEIREAVVPIYPAEFSALGFVLADARVDCHRTVQLTSARFDRLRASQVMQELVRNGVSGLRLQGYSGEPAILRSMEARYVGQNYELEIPVSTDGFDSDNCSTLWAAFHDIHNQRFGFCMPGENIEIVNFKVSVVLPNPKPIFPTVPKAQSGPEIRCSRTVFFANGVVDSPVIDRNRLQCGHRIIGPALVEEAGTVTVLCPGQLLTVDSMGNMRVSDLNSEPEFS